MDPWEVFFSLRDSFYFVQLTLSYLAFQWRHSTCFPMRISFSWWDAWNFFLKNHAENLIICVQTVVSLHESYWTMNMTSFFQKKVWYPSIKYSPPIACTDENGNSWLIAQFLFDCWMIAFGYGLFLVVKAPENVHN